MDDAERDVIGLQVVTVGQKASDTARLWFEDNRYQDYLYLHGLSVEMAEAMAEYTHKRIRAELGFAGEDDRDIEKMLAQGYRGSRYSFGYPACPKLEDQEPLLRLLGRRADRRLAVRRVAAASGAVHQRDRGAEPAGEVLLRVATALQRTCRRAKRPCTVALRADRRACTAGANAGDVPCAGRATRVTGRARRARDDRGRLLVLA